MLAAAIVLAVWGTGGIQAPPGSAQMPRRSELSPRQLIAALDTCIQKRFRMIDTAFGIRRVVRLEETPHVFRPGDTAEWGAVQDLDRAKLEVLLYVAGRRVLTEDPELAGLVDARGWSAVKGPVEITGGSGSGEPRPASTDLLDAARQTFEASVRGEDHDFRSGAWQFVGRPVRATETACLNCHTRRGATELRIGDPLGVVLYGYRAR
jgi:hypothetical protein